MRHDNPCRDCDRREIGCHGRCENYIAWSTERTAQLQKARAGRQADSVIIESTYRNKQPMLRFRRSQGK